MFLDKPKDWIIFIIEEAAKLIAKDDQIETYTCIIITFYVVRIHFNIFQDTPYLLGEKPMLETHLLEDSLFFVFVAYYERKYDFADLSTVCHKYPFLSLQRQNFGSFTCNYVF